MNAIEEIAGHTQSQPDPNCVRLEASREITTGKGTFPRIPATSPSADQYEPITLSPEATLYSFTVIHPNPKTGQQPFTLIYADFPENTRVFGRLSVRADEHPRIGAAVRVIQAAENTDGASNYSFELL